jgi:hypothetical protein
MTAKAAIDSLCHEIVLGISRLLVAGKNRVGIAGWQLYIAQDEHPAFAPTFKAIGEAAPIYDPGERLFQCWDGVAANVRHILQFLCEDHISHSVLPGLPTRTKVEQNAKIVQILGIVGGASGSRKLVNREEIEIRHDGLAEVSHVT